VSRPTRRTPNRGNADRNMSACHDFRRAGRLSRRDLLRAGSLGTFGLGLADLMRHRASAGTIASSPSAPGFGQAKRCLILFMWGGPSHIDTWDPKPEAPSEIRGEFAAIDTNVPGIQIGEHFPMLARQVDKLAIVRSMTHDDPAHLSSVHHILTGRHAPQVKSDRDPPSRRDWPHIGSALGKLRPTSAALPPFVTMPWYVSHPAAPGGLAPGQHGGLLGPGYDPFVVTGDPNAADFRVDSLGLPSDVSLDRFDSRRALLETIDSQVARIERRGAAGDYSDYQEQAFAMVASPEARRAFDLSEEKPEVRDRYGRHIHGQCLLLSRRLLESGVPLVQVNWHNEVFPGAVFWDTHAHNFVHLKSRLMPPNDQGFSALLDDLAERGMLEDTLVVWVGEFGRRPQVTTGNAGRDHWPFCYSTVLAGAGVRGGQIYGRSDAQGGFPATDPVAPHDLTATIYHALGIPSETMLVDPQTRPVRITEGQPLTRLFG